MIKVNNRAISVILYIIAFVVVVIIVAYAYVSFEQDEIEEIYGVWTHDYVDDVTFESIEQIVTFSEDKTYIISEDGSITYSGTFSITKGDYSGDKWYDNIVIVTFDNHVGIGNGRWYDYGVEIINDEMHIHGTFGRNYVLTK